MSHPPTASILQFLRQKTYSNPVDLCDIVSQNQSQHPVAGKKSAKDQFVTFTTALLCSADHSAKSRRLPRWPSSTVNRRHTLENDARILKSSRGSCKSPAAVVEIDEKRLNHRAQTMWPDISLNPLAGKRRPTL